MHRSTDLVELSVFKAFPGLNSTYSGTFSWGGKPPQTPPTTALPDSEIHGYNGAVPQFLQQHYNNSSHLIQGHDSRTHFHFYLASHHSISVFTSLKTCLISPGRTERNTRAQIVRPFSCFPLVFSEKCSKNQRKMHHC